MTKPKKNITEQEKIKDPKRPEQKAPQKDPVQKDREYNLDHETYSTDKDADNK